MEKHALKSTTVLGQIVMIVFGLLTGYNILAPALDMPTITATQDQIMAVLMALSGVFIPLWTIIQRHKNQLEIYWRK